MAQQIAVSLFDVTGNIVSPWAKAGFLCAITWIYNIRQGSTDRETLSASALMSENGSSPRAD
jgi:hypothetical protein